MYGTLDDKNVSIPIEQQQQQQNGDTPRALSSSGASDGPDGAARGQADLEQAQRRRRKKIYSHCHVQSAESPAGAHGGGDSQPPNVDKSARRRLIAASVICLVFMIGEVVGGLYSGSLAIATDAAHLLTDFASFMISLFAIWLSTRPATRKMSFGWYRAEVIGALLSVLMIWLVTGLLVYLAVERIRTQEFEIDSQIMVITAAAGLLVNIIMAVALHHDGHGHGHSHAHGHSHGHGHGHGHSHAHDISHHNHLDHLNDEEDDDDDHDGARNHHHHHQEQNYDELFERDHDKGEGRGEARQRERDQNHVSIDCSMKATLTGKMNEKLQQVAGASDSGGEEKRKQVAKVKSKCCGNGSSAGAAAGRGKSNINVRAAFIHVVGDFLQSLGVLIAALVIHFEPSYAIVDPICTFLFSVIVLITTINIIRDAVNVLMEGIPDGINFIEVREKLQSEPYVIRVHNLRIWSLSLDKVAISTHLVIDAERITSAQALRRAIGLLKNSYNFFEVTIQIEEYQKDMRDCEHCQDDDSVNVVRPLDSNGSHQSGGGDTTTSLPKEALA